MIIIFKNKYAILTMNADLINYELLALIPRNFIGIKKINLKYLINDSLIFLNRKFIPDYIIDFNNIAVKLLLKYTDVNLLCHYSWYDTVIDTYVNIEQFCDLLDLSLQHCNLSVTKYLLLSRRNIDCRDSSYFPTPLASSINNDNIRGFNLMQNLINLNDADYYYISPNNNYIGFVFVKLLFSSRDIRALSALKISESRFKIIKNDNFIRKILNLYRNDRRFPHLNKNE